MMRALLVPQATRPAHAVSPERAPNSNTSWSWHGMHSPMWGVDNQLFGDKRPGRMRKELPARQNSIGPWIMSSEPHSPCMA